MKTNFKKFIVKINLGHRIARVRTYAINATAAFLKVYNRFAKRIPTINSYSIS